MILVRRVIAETMSGGVGTNDAADHFLRPGEARAASVGVVARDSNTSR